jgi:hypothetical protein
MSFRNWPYLVVHLPPSTKTWGWNAQIFILIPLVYYGETGVRRLPYVMLAPFHFPPKIIRRLPNYARDNNLW